MLMQARRIAARRGDGRAALLEAEQRVAVGRCPEAGGAAVVEARLVEATYRCRRARSGALGDVVSQVSPRPALNTVCASDTTLAARPSRRRGRGHDIPPGRRIRATVLGTAPVARPSCDAGRRSRSPGRRGRPDWGGRSARSRSGTCVPCLDPAAFEDVGRENPGGARRRSGRPRPVRPLSPGWRSSAPSADLDVAFERRASRSPRRLRHHSCFCLNSDGTVYAGRPERLDALEPLLHVAETASSSRCRWQASRMRWWKRSSGTVRKTVCRKR